MHVLFWGEKQNSNNLSGILLETFQGRNLWGNFTKKQTNKKTKILAPLERLLCWYWVIIIGKVSLTTAQGAPH